jgi:Trm5-related predicted tRNA methylase
MTSTTVLLKGKYIGLTYKEILDKDINYCLFILSLRFVSNELKEFKEWLSLNIEEAKVAHLKRKADAMAKQLLG